MGDLSELPSGFQALILEGSISRNVVRIIARISRHENWQLEDLIDFFSLDAKPEPHHDDGTDCAYLQDSFPLHFVHGKQSEPLIENLLYLALMRYCINQANEERSKVCVLHTTTVDLSTKLVEFVTSSGWDNRPVKPLLIWMWLVAVESWAAGPDDLAPAGIKLFGQLLEHVSITRSWSEKDFDELCRKFFWSENTMAVLRGRLTVRVHTNQPGPHANASALSLLATLFT